jgi:hypothetical protein
VWQWVSAPAWQQKQPCFNEEDDHESHELDEGGACCKTVPGTLLFRVLVRILGFFWGLMLAGLGENSWPEQAPNTAGKEDGNLVHALLGREGTGR